MIQDPNTQDQDWQEVYRWAKAWDNGKLNLPKEKGSYISRTPTATGNDWVIHDKPFNPKYEDNYLNIWSKAGVEWLERITLPLPVGEDVVEVRCNGCGCNKYRSEYDYKECINCHQRFVIENGEIFDIETPIK